MFVFRKIWRALFFCYLRLEIRLFCYITDEFMVSCKVFQIAVRGEEVGEWGVNSPIGRGGGGRKFYWGIFYRVKGT